MDLFIGGGSGDYLSYYYDLCAAIEKLSPFLSVSPTEDGHTTQTSPRALASRNGFNSLKEQEPPRIARALARLFSTAIVLILLFVCITPWIQTAAGVGHVTTLNPSDRAQAIHSLVKGRVRHWYVSDGAHVKKDDPLVEIVDNDPQLVERLKNERDAVVNKLETLTLAMQTAELNHNRQLRLNQQGLTSRKEYEQALIRWKEIKAQVAQAQADVNKVEVQFSRQSSQLVRAPRDGFVTHIAAGGISTHVKEGDLLATFVPKDTTPAVELYANGLDAPLIYPGRKVRVIFEGWPSIQFSGWPSVAVGTFPAQVVSIDSTISPNGKFRVLLAKPENENWPDARFLRMGSRVKGWVLLNEVSVAYELWRQLNSFPPMYDAPEAGAATGQSPGSAVKKNQAGAK